MLKNIITFEHSQNKLIKTVSNKYSVQNVVFPMMKFKTKYSRIFSDTESIVFRNFLLIII